MTISDLERLFPILIANFNWQFDINDTATIYTNWPVNSEIDKLAQDLHYVHSFYYHHNDDKLFCVLHPAKNAISVSADYENKNKLYNFINDFNLKINLNNLDQEIFFLDKKRQDLMRLKMLLNSILIKKQYGK